MPHSSLPLLLAVSLWGCAGPTSEASPTTPSDPVNAPTSTNTWFRIDRGVTPLGIIAFETGKVGTVDFVRDGPEVAKIEASLPSISSPEGISEKMHVGGKNGGRGSLALVDFPTDHPEYPSMFLMKIKATGVNVEPIQANTAPPAGVITMLRVEVDGAKAGDIELGATPTLTQPSGEPTHAMRMLKTSWDQAVEMKTLQVWYVVTKNGRQTLETRKATIGDADYGEVLRIWLHHQTRLGGKPQFEVQVVE